MKAIIYGAGNIGRGFMGQIFAQSGYELTFIDVADTVIETLNRHKRYPIRILAENRSEDIWIDGVRAINGRNEEEAAEAIAKADIMATSVGVRALPLITPVIAAGLKKRFAQYRKPLNIIICENLIDAHKVLGGFLKEHLNDEEYFEEYIGLVEASIGRMVPLQTEEMQDGNPLRICVEAYGFLPVDKAGFKGEIPHIKGMLPFDNFDFYIQRKLFIHNMGHGICAYFGLIGGFNFIYETVNHTGILFIAQNAMLESALALSAKYQMPLADLHYHIRDLLLRFSNKSLGDTCARVAADTPRKLGNKDRFIGALHNCAGKGSAFITAGISAALYCCLKEKNLPLNREAACKALAEISGLTGEKAEKVLAFYSLLISPRSSNFDKAIEKIIRAAFQEGHQPDII
jgi:mannitol-1-phosphate 5-dehydrogenase